MRVLQVLVWDAMFCIVLSISHYASATLVSQDSSYIVTLITFAVCGAFLGHLTRIDAPVIIFVTIPALYIVLAPFIGPLLAMIPISVTLPFEITLPSFASEDVVFLRYAAALTAGYTLWKKTQG